MKKLLILMSIIGTQTCFAVEYNKYPKNIKCIKNFGTIICSESMTKNSLITTCTKLALFELKNGRDEYAYLKTEAMAPNKIFASLLTTAKARGEMDSVVSKLEKIPYCLNIFN